MHCSAAGCRQDLLFLPSVHGNVPNRSGFGENGARAVQRYQLQRGLHIASGEWKGWPLNLHRLSVCPVEHANNSSKPTPLRGAA
jgi:hypothetical protein